MLGWELFFALATLVVASHTFVFQPASSGRRNLLSPRFSSADVAIDTSSTGGDGDGSEGRLPYNWKHQWYALTFASYVPNPSKSAEAVPAAVFGHPLVLWRSKDDGPIHCADDVCPHRAAALSEGRVRDGNLECLYHGWSFAGDTGSCQHIPQLASGAEIPQTQRACLRMRLAKVVEGIVWVWMGDATETAPPPPPPPRQNDGLDEQTGKRKGFFLTDFQIDLPYDHSYLAENLIDPAHIPISHDSTRGGGRREDAQAYEMIVDKDSVSEKGFTGRYRTESASRDGKPFTELQYEAPGIIRQQGSFPGNITFGAALHCMPLTLGRSRLLFRTYVGGLPMIMRLIISLKPKWQFNLGSCKILEQDVGLITTQEDHFARNPERALKDDFLLLKSSDLFVGEYRKWLDRVGPGMPWFQGLVSRSANVDAHLTGSELPPALMPAGHRSSGQETVETRYHRHVLHCPETYTALRRVKFLKTLSAAFSVAAISLMSAVSTFSSLNAALPRPIARLLVPSTPVFALVAALLYKLEQKFYVSFKRKDQLRMEKGI